MTRQGLIATLPKGLRCAELGVFAGDFSRDIFNIMRPAHLFLVDSFTGMFASADQNGENRVELHLETVEYCLRKEFGHRKDVEIVRANSLLWLASMPSDSLDFVYIDTTHSHEQTKAELSWSMRVVRPGGWIAGHDYHPRFEGVIQAVTELNLPVALTKDGLPSWMVQRPY